MRDERADAELLSSGVGSDFGFLYDRHVRAVTAFVGSWIGEPEVVFDLVAETFARALEHRLQYDPSKGPAVAWLLAIARNLMIDSARRGRVESDSRERLGMGHERVVGVDDVARSSVHLSPGGVEPSDLKRQERAIAKSATRHAHHPVAERGVVPHGGVGSRELEPPSTRLATRALLVTDPSQVAPGKAV